MEPQRLIPSSGVHTQRAYRPPGRCPNCQMGKNDGRDCASHRRPRTHQPASPAAPDNDCYCHDTFTDLLEDYRDWHRRRVQFTARMDTGEKIELFECSLAVGGSGVEENPGLPRVIVHSPVDALADARRRVALSSATHA